MANRHFDAIITRPFHAHAERLARDYSLDFATSLILQAKLLAHSRGDDVVTQRHVEDARYVLRSQQEQESWTRQFLNLIGSAIFGASFAAFVREALTSSPNMSWIVGFGVAGFLALILVSWQLRR